MNKLILTRNQVEKLWEIVSHFKEVDQFTVEVDRSSGIGPNIVVTFDLFKKSDTHIDITDVSNW